MMTIRLLAAFTVFAVASASALPSSAQAPSAPDLTDLSVEDLLRTEVVSTASKFPQEIREAPASITVVTAEDIRRYGHRSLDDILRSVRGFYTTYDRNYSYVGVRGFARPGDYNTRMLLLIDGHRLNDPIYDMAPVGTDFPIDVSLIEKVEVIRGPGSTLYGTSAFFAVVNVVTRTGAQVEGVRVETHAGSLETRGGSARYGQVFSNHNELVLGAAARRSQGASRLYFPELDDAGGHGGIASGLDGSDSSSLFGSLSLGRVTLSGLFGSSDKHVPTAAWDTVFGDDRFTTNDTHGYLTATYDGPISRGWSGTLRAAYDFYGYEGFYPFDYGELGTSAMFDAARSHTITGEASVRRRFARLHLVTAGAEVRGSPKHRMWTLDALAPETDLDIKGNYSVTGLYVQDEFRLRPWALLSAGVRADHYRSSGGRMTPRAGLVLLPRTQTSIKLLYGEAFRAPNVYELSYFDTMRQGGYTLEPENVRSFEAVWEEYISTRVRTAVTAFQYDAERIIEQKALDEDGAQIYFTNSGHVHGLGGEAEVEARLAHGVNARFSHTYARAEDRRSDSPFFNSPRHLSKIGLQVPVARAVAAFEGQYVGERLTLAGTPLPGFFVSNVTMTSPVTSRLDVSLRLYNAFDTAYSDPGNEEHRQDAIPQDGRKLMATARVKF